MSLQYPYAHPYPAPVVYYPPAQNFPQQFSRDYQPAYHQPQIQTRLRALEESHGFVMDVQPDHSSERKATPELEEQLKDQPLA